MTAKEPKADVVSLPNDENVNAILLYNKKARIPKDAHAYLLKRGIVPIEIEELTDVKLVTVPITHRVDSTRIDFITLAALKALAVYTDNGPPGHFGKHLANLLIAADTEAKDRQQAKE